MFKGVRTSFKQYSHDELRNIESIFIDRNALCLLFTTNFQSWTQVWALDLDGS